MTPIQDPITLYGIIIALAGVVMYLYRENKSLNKQLLDNERESSEKLTSVAEAQLKQQELWFDKLQVASKGK